MLSELYMKEKYNEDKNVYIKQKQLQKNDQIKS